MLLQYFYIMFFPRDDIYFANCTSPSCSRTQSQYDAATLVLHSWDNVLRLASNSSILVSSDRRTGLRPYVHLQTVFRVMASSSLSGLSAHVDTALCLTSFSQHLHKVFCSRSFLGTEPISFLSDMMAGHAHGVYTFVWLFEQMNMALSGICKLYPTMNQVSESPQFSSWHLGWFLFPMMSHKEAVCLRCALKYIHRWACN